MSTSVILYFSSLVRDFVSVRGATGGKRRVKIVDVIDTKRIKVDTDLSDVKGSFDETGNLNLTIDTEFTSNILRKK